MDMTGLGGIWPASLTPFAPGGAIDQAALHQHLADLAATPGVRALVVNGHAGEASALDAAERRLVVRVARQVAAGRVAVVAGVIADDTRTACALARDAAAEGADAILLFPPALFAAGANMRPEMALHFVAAVAAATPLPIVLFQLSRASGLGFDTPLLARLCREVPRIVAVKEGSDTPAAYEDNLLAIRACGRPVAVLTTNNTWLLESLVQQPDGMLSGIGSVVPEVLAEMFAAAQRGDWPAARRANDRLRPLTRAFYRAPGLDMHNRMKTALHLLGRLPHPAPRPPLLPIEPAEREAIRAALAEAGLLRAVAA